jgi:hypothetical protein
MYKRLKTPTSIAVLYFDGQKELAKTSYWAEKHVIALAAVSKVIVCTLDNTNEEILNLKRPKICRENSVPYIEFGFGLSPNQCEVAPILVIAWDKIIQLVYFDENQ